MGVGVALPLRFSQGHGTCIGGFGLASGDLNGKEFNKIWAEHDQEIIQLSALFDILARERHADSLFQLTPREKECLKWLAIGLRPQQICDKLNNAYRTTEKQIASARQKLNAHNNEQAVAKALVYGLLEPRT
jgi:DNA-binding CsgD family transcriptional regulator